MNNNETNPFSGMDGMDDQSTVVIDDPILNRAGNIVTSAEETMVIDEPVLNEAGNIVNPEQQAAPAMPTMPTMPEQPAQAFSATVQDTQAGQPYGQNPYGSQDYNQNPYGNQDYNNQSAYGQNAYGNQSYGQNAYGNQTAYDANAYSAAAYTQPTYTSANSAQGTPGHGKAVASLVLGICSIVLCWLYGIIGLVCGIVGFILANQSGNEAGGEKSGIAKAGFICSIVGLSLSALALIYYIVVVWILAGTYSSFSRYY